VARAVVLDPPVNTWDDESEEWRIEALDDDGTQLFDGTRWPIETLDGDKRRWACGRSRLPQLKRACGARPARLQRACGADWPDWNVLADNAPAGAMDGGAPPEAPTAVLAAEVDVADGDRAMEGQEEQDGAMEVARPATCCGDAQPPPGQRGRTTSRSSGS